MDKYATIPSAQNLKVMIIRSYDKILNIEINSRRPSIESPPSWHAECILGGETGAAQTEIPYRGFEAAIKSN
jgi:hypothetical protein